VHAAANQGSFQAGTLAVYEVHPSDLAAFDLQVLCEKSEFRIIANDISFVAIGEKKKRQRH
jgi:hypothetical protein